MLLVPLGFHTCSFLSLTSSPFHSLLISSLPSPLPSAPPPCPLSSVPPCRPLLSLLLPFSSYQAPCRSPPPSLSPTP